MKRFLLVWVAAAVLVSANGFGAGLIIVEDTHWWPGPNPGHPIPPPWPPRPMPPRQYSCTPLEVNYVKVKTRIADQIAVTAVDQEFYNPNSARLEGTFIFPVPKGSHLDKFTMEIDGKQVQAELLGADKARGIYEDIVRKLRDPALLEYAGRDVFKVRIFPIEPNSPKRITFSYSELLKAEDGLVNYVLPLNTEKFSTKPIHTVSVKVDLECKRPLKSIYSPSHTVEIKREGSNRAVAGYEASEVQPDTDFSLYFAPEKDEIGVNLLTHKIGGEDGYFLLLASPGSEVKQQQVVAKDVAFVLDTSGSMAGKKLDQAKKALQFCVENLNESDRFQLIRFSTEVEPLFNGLVAASKGNCGKAEDFIKDLKPMGATDIDGALKQALLLGGHKSSGDDDPGADTHPASRMNDRPFVVIFLTDGQPTIGTTDEQQIVAHVKQAGAGHTRIFCFGIGTDVNTHLLDKIAEETHAFSQYVLPDEDLELKVSNFYAKIKEPVLANPRLRFTGDARPSKLYPSPLPDLFKGEQLVLVGRYAGSGAAAVLLEGSVNGTPKKHTYEVSFPAETSENEFIPRLWATRRVGYLLDEIRLHGENSELREETTELARKYGIVTPYTAYLILDDEAHRNVPMAMRSMQGLENDRAARGQAEKTWNEFKVERAGESAIVTARAATTLKMADAPAQAAADNNLAFSRRYGLAPRIGGPAGTLNLPAQPPPADNQAKLAQYAQQNQFVAGKNFFQNDKQWIDGAVQQLSNTNRVRIQFNSTEYFDFARKNPRALPWLALGQNVQFALGNTVYEIYE